MSRFVRGSDYCISSHPNASVAQRVRNRSSIVAAASPSVSDDVSTPYVRRRRVALCYLLYMDP